MSSMWPCVFDCDPKTIVSFVLIQEKENFEHNTAYRDAYATLTNWVACDETFCTSVSVEHVIKDDRARCDL